jgi:hypothetical protein
MNCPICSRKIQDKWKLCSDHLLALKKIQKAFKVWNRAHDGILKREYLAEVTNRPETGKLAIEVTQFLLEDGEHMTLWPNKKHGD